MNPDGRSRFGRIERGSPERRLSEMFALVLGEPGVASHLVRSLTGIVVDAEPRLISTELPTDRGKFVDLEIKFDSPSGLTVWIEVKRDLGAESSEGQVQGYVEELAERCGDTSDGIVLYLPRPGVPDPAPEEIGKVKYRYSDWTKVGRILEAGPDSSLTADFVKFLNEEGLYVLPIENAGLEQINRGIASQFETLIAEAKRGIETAVSRRLGVNPSLGEFWPARPGAWILGWGRQNTFANFPVPLPSPEAQEAKLEWNLRRRASAGIYQDEVVFSAGLTWIGDESFPWNGRESKILAALNSRGDGEFEAHVDDRSRIVRWMLPSAVVGGAKTFEGQVEELVSFVLKAFTDVVRALESLDSVPPVSPA